ncbi:hypothetical protein [Mucilaginibacter sp.]
MKTIMFIFLCLVHNCVSGQVIKNIKVYYHDDQTTKNKNVYRELQKIQDNPIWSQPDRLDIEVIFSSLINMKDYENPENIIQVSLEELYQATSLGMRYSKLNKIGNWVPNQVLFSGNNNFVKGNKLVIKDVKYQTAYFLSSLLYNKIGFRIVALYYRKDVDKVETLTKTYLLSQD